MDAAKEHFASLLEGATVQTLDPMCCLPFTRIRNIVNGCVKVLCKIFEDAGGLTSGGSMAYVIKLEGVFASYPLEYFREKLGNENDARKEVQKREEWYGVVDGEHRATALQKLICEEPAKWAGFSWTVTVLKTSASIATLRAFARSCNQKNVDDFVIVPTQFDVLRNLKQDYITLSAKLNRNAKPIELAVFYSGSKDACTSTIKQLAGCVIRLPQSVVDTLGEIVNEEHEDVARQIHSKTNSKQDRCSAVDFRLYRNLISSSTFKGSTPFMNANGLDGESAQINSLWRIREIARSSGYGPTKPSVLTEQFLAASAALQEIRKFEKLMESSIWPSEMEVMKKNAERTQLFDEDIAANHGNQLEPLPAFFKAYKTACPAVADQKLQKFKGAVNNILDTDNPCSGDPSIEPTAHPDHAHHLTLQNRQNEMDNNEVARHNADGDATSEGSKEKTLTEDLTEGTRQLDGAPKPNDCSSFGYSNRGPTSGSVHQEGNFANGSKLSGEDTLKSLGINCFPMEWQHFEKHCEMYEKMKGKVHTILTDPPYSLQSNSASGAGSTYDDFLDDKEINAFTQFSRRILCPEGSVVMFTSWQSFPRWSASFTANGFHVLNYPLIIAKDTKTLRRNGRLKMPQCAVDFILLAYAPGTGKECSRSIDFDCPYQLIHCTHSRKFNIIDNVPVPNAKLQHNHSRKIVRVEEKNVELLQELLTSFCPPDGLVCDPYAGTLTTAIACLQTSREAVVIEKDRICMSLSMARLSKIALNVAKKKKVTGRSALGTARLQNQTEVDDIGCQVQDHRDRQVRRSEFLDSQDGNCNIKSLEEGESVKESNQKTIHKRNETKDVRLICEPTEIKKRRDSSPMDFIKSVRQSKRLKKTSTERENRRYAKKIGSDKTNLQSGVQTESDNALSNESHVKQYTSSIRTNCVLGELCDVLSLIPVGESAMTSHKCDKCDRNVHNPCEYGKRVLGLQDRCEKRACSKDCFESSK